MKASITTLHTHTHLYNAGLCLVLVLSACLYIYLVSSAVNEVVVRKELTRDIRDVRSEIAYLESEYIKAQHVVSERIATAADYQEPEEKLFVSREESSLVLSAETAN